jgi:hypothetical protein
MSHNDLLKTIYDIDLVLQKKPTGLRDLLNRQWLLDEILRINTLLRKQGVIK